MFTYIQPDSEDYSYKYVQRIGEQTSVIQSYYSLPPPHLHHTSILLPNTIIYDGRH
jgi:hypothetical protein